MSFRPLAQGVPGQILASAAAFRVILALPRVRLVAVSSLVARLPKGMVPLAIVFLLRQDTGSYAIAGLTAAVAAAGDAVSTPMQGRLADRFGRGLVLIPAAAVHVAAVAALLLLLTRTGAPAGALVTCASVAGIGMPPVSGSIKAVWPQLAGEDRLPAAYALESLLQQMVFLSGPLLVTVLTAAGGPAAALACSALLVAAGTGCFVAAVPPAPATPATPGRGGQHPQRARGIWRTAAVRTLVCTTMLQSMTFGALPVGLAAAAAGAGLPDLAGILLAALTAGGVAGTFGPVTAAGKRHYVRLMAGFTGGLLPVAALSTGPSPQALIAIGVALAAAGLFVTPLAAASYVLIQRAISPAHRTEAFGWLSAGQATGNAAGAALAGILAARAGAPVALAVPPAAAGLAAILARALLPGEAAASDPGAAASGPAGSDGG